MFYLGQSKTPFFMYGTIQFGPQTGLFPLPLPKDALCQDWLKLTQWFLKRNFLISPILSLFRNYLPLEKDMALHLNKLESPTPKDALCAKFG